MEKMMLVAARVRVYRERRRRDRRRRW